MNTPPRHRPTDRDRALGRLRTLTIGTAIAGVAAVAGFGVVAAASDSGAGTTTVTSDGATTTTTTTPSSSSTTQAATAAPVTVSGPVHATTAASGQ
jgi:hypothetical protein